MLEEVCLISLCYTPSQKRREDLMNKMCHFALHDKSKELQGKRSYSTLLILTAPSHSQCSMCCCSSGNKAYLHSIVGWVFFTQAAISFLRIRDCISKAHLYYKTNLNKTFWRERWEKWRKDIYINEQFPPSNIYHLLQIIKRWHFPKNTLQVIFVISTSL